MSNLAEKIDISAWLEERRSGIGGSDAGAVCGVNKYKTPYQVWEDKTGKADPIPDNAPMLWGRNLEPVIRQHYSDVTGRVVMVPDMIIRHPKHPFMLANLDGFTEDRRVLEVKTARSGQDWGEPGTDEIPLTYLFQMQHYMAVTGYEVADVAVLIGGQDFRLYEIPADAELQEMMIEQEAEFWKLVECSTPPEPVSYQDMVQRFKTSTEAKKVITPEISQALERLRVLREGAKAIDGEEELLKVRIMAEMGEADTLTDLDGNVLVTWKSGKATERFDTKSFQSAHPDLYRQFSKRGDSARRFLLK